jgi:TPP-dependent pyruvate/acetoin dehydrogenase alpha subunit
MISHLGAMLPVAAGAIMARRHKGVDSVGFAYIGDGGTSTGDFHEATNFSAVFDIPLVIVIENNRYAYSTPTCNQYRCDQLIDRAAGYGIEGISVDGNDVFALHDVFLRTVEAIRQQPRPVMIECHTMRMRGHGEHDDFSYVPNELIVQFKEKDPIQRARDRILEAGIASEADIAAMESECLGEVDAAYQQALKDPTPDPDTLLDGVYADE